MDIAAIRTSLEEVYRENRALIAGLTEADMDRPTPNPRWKVRQLAAHIAEDDAGALYVGKLLARGKNAKAPDFLINLTNWWGLRKYRRARPADLLPVLDDRHQKLLTWLDSVAPEDLQRGGEISQMGTMSLGEFLVKNGAHSREHAADIRAALGGAMQPGGAAGQAPAQ